MWRKALNPQAYISLFFVQGRKGEREREGGKKKDVMNVTYSIKYRSVCLWSITYHHMTVRSCRRHTIRCTTSLAASSAEPGHRRMQAAPQADSQLASRLLSNGRLLFFFFFFSPSLELGGLRMPDTTALFADFPTDDLCGNRWALQTSRLATRCHVGGV